MRRIIPTLVAAAVAVLLAACAAEDAASPDGEPTPPADEPTAEPSPDPDDPEAGAMEISGTFDGDPDLEGGCAWVEARGERFEVLWPEGYEVHFDPVRLTGPDGEEVAAAGDPVTVTGEVAEDMASFCMVGTMFQAHSVEAG